MHTLQLYTGQLQHLISALDSRCVWKYLIAPVSSQSEKIGLKNSCYNFVINLNYLWTMKLNNENVKETIDNAKALLAKEKNISPALRSVIQLLLVFMEVMLNRLSLNSKNSSKSPSSDPNRKKSSTGKKTNKKSSCHHHLKIDPPSNWKLIPLV